MNLLKIHYFLSVVIILLVPYFSEAMGYMKDAGFTDNMSGLDAFEYHFFILSIAISTKIVWVDMSIYLDGKISKNALRLFVQQDRHDILHHLGITTSSNQQSQNTEPRDKNLKDVLECDSESESSDDMANFQSKIFTITFSHSEWKQIEPAKVRYKSNEVMSPGSSLKYFVLPIGTWTSLISEHFWAHTRLPCHLAFRRSKVYTEGDTFITVVGRCTVFESRFIGKTAEKQSDETRVLMKCEFPGNLNEHGVPKEQRLVECTRDRALMNGEMSGETEALVRLMNFDDNGERYIHSGGALKYLKWKQKFRDKRYPNTLTAIAIMQLEDNYKNIIHDLFFIHYHNTE